MLTSFDYIIYFLLFQEKSPNYTPLQLGDFILCLYAFAISNKKVPPPEPKISKNSTSAAPPGVRTLDTLIKSQVLYQLS